MEATREIYWNIGHGVVIPMYLLSIAAVAVLAWNDHFALHPGGVGDAANLVRVLACYAGRGG